MLEVGLGAEKDYQVFPVKHNLKERYSRHCCNVPLSTEQLGVLSTSPLHCTDCSPNSQPKPPDEEGSCFWGGMSLAYGSEHILVLHPSF